MKRRRGRRGFWWWSWLLALITIAGVVGGYFYGNHRWEDAPKDYRSFAKVSVHIRPPFVARGANLESTASRLDNLNEAAVLRDIKSDAALSAVITTLGLSQKWALGTNDALTELRASVELEHDRLAKELFVIVSRHDPNESAQVANLIANGVADRVKAVDEQQRLEGSNKLELELQPFVDSELIARNAIKDACAAKSIPFDSTTGIKDRTYLLDPVLRDAHLEWDSARDNLAGVKRSQTAFESHWNRDVRPTMVTEKAVPPPHFSGPEVKPFQMQWALYGLTLGLVFGSVLSLICWKLFP